MAEPDDILRRYGPADPRWLTPEDLAGGIVDRYGPVDQFKLPPKEPRAELRNLPHGREITFPRYPRP